MLHSVKLIKFTNGSKHTLKLPEPFGCTVAPGTDVEVPEEWTKPRRLENGARGKSPIEMIAPQLKPADKDFAAEWAKVPAAPAKSAAPGRQPTVGSLMQAGLSKAVAEALLQSQAAAVEE